MYVITEWFERYEVNDKGQPARPGDKLRASPLLYIRSKVHGHHQSAGFAALQKQAPENSYEVFGMFQKFLEVSGNSGSRFRGILLNHRGAPANLDDLAHILREKTVKIRGALQVLTHTEVAWMAEMDDSVFQEFQEFQENWSAFLNETKRNETELNETQRNETTPGKPDKATIPPVDGTKDNGEVFDDCSRDSSSTSTRPSDSARLKFGSELRKMLGVISKSDTTALWNLQSWADRLTNTGELYRRILAIAKDSQNGRNPIAVFFSRVDQELGYRARVEADKRKG